MQTTISKHPDLKFHLEWEEDHPSAQADAATWGRLAVSLGSELVWGEYGSEDQPQGIRWTWIDLAEHLAQEWAWLEWEQGWPLDLPAASPCDLPVLLEQRVSRLARPYADQAREKFHEWRTTHDLSRAVRGASGLPALWLARFGKRMWVASDTQAYLLPLREVLDTLVELVEHIMTRVQAVKDDSRGIELVRGWRERLKRPTEEKISIATGFKDTDLARLAGGKPIPVFFQAPKKFDLSEKMVAARMLRDAASLEVLRRVLLALDDVDPAAPSAALEAASEAVQAALGSGHAEPYREGQIVARALRKHLEFEIEDRIDPEEILERFEVAVLFRDLGSGSEVVDGFACWGPNHGPTVFVNTRGIHSNSTRGSRATVAHEIGHLLLDREDTLPLAEVKGRLPVTKPEQRASAFAAELLLPQEVAGSLFAEGGDPSSTLRSVATRFGASYAIVAWQALNSGIVLPRRTERFLATKAPQPIGAPGVHSPT